MVNKRQIHKIEGKMNKSIGIYVLLVVSVFLFNCQKSEQKTQINNALDTTSQEIIDECQEFIEVHSASFWANETGWSEQYVQANYKINTWEKESSQGKGGYVGELLPGSRALIIKEGVDDYKVKSPLDNTVGWISKIQVSRTLFQNIHTYEPCEQ